MGNCQRETETGYRRGICLFSDSAATSVAITGTDLVVSAADLHLPNLVAGGYPLPVNSEMTKTLIKL